MCLCNRIFRQWVCVCCVIQIAGGVTAAKGFKASGVYGGLRAATRKPDLALVVCDVDAVIAGEYILFLLLEFLIRRSRLDIFMGSFLIILQTTFHLYPLSFCCQASTELCFCLVFS